MRPEPTSPLPSAVSSPNPEPPVISPDRDITIRSARTNVSNTKNSWFNQVKLSADRKEKTLYLGMIPDNVQNREIPGGCKFTSILQPFETEFMDKNIHTDFQVTVHSEDNKGMSPEEIDRGVVALKKAFDSKDKQPIYLHCKSGVGRSATVLAAYLMKYRGKTLEEAINIVQRDRPDAHLKKSNGRDTKHTKALKEYEKKQIERMVPKTSDPVAEFLGQDILWSGEKTLLSQMLKNNPKLHEDLIKILRGLKNPATQKEILALYSGLVKQSDLTSSPS